MQAAIANTGIGQGIAVALASAGADVACVGRTPAEDTVVRIRALGHSAEIVSADLSTIEPVGRVVDETVAKLGRLDILINNAGIIRRADAVDFTEEDWDAVIDTNLKSVFFPCQAAGRHMIAQGSGKIVNIASMLTFQGGIRVPSYTASKSGIGDLTKLLANEWAGKGINVNAIAPGYIATNNTAALQADKTRNKAILDRIPAGKWGDADDLGGAAVFLACRASDYVQGHLPRCSVPASGGGAFCEVANARRGSPPVASLLSASSSIADRQTDMTESFDASPIRSNLNFFYTLDAILNTRSLTEAASRANLSQPAMSMALKRARLHYHDEIVVTSGTERRFTDLATALRPRVRRLLREAQLALDLSLEFNADHDRATIRVSMPDFVEALFLPRLLQQIRRTAPGVELLMMPFEYVSAEHQFERAIDFVILPPPLTDHNYGTAFLYDDELCVLVSVDHPAATTELGYDDYVEGFHAGLFDHIDLLAPPSADLAALLAARNVVARTSIYSALPAMVIDTDLIVTTSSRYAQHCASFLPVTPVPLPLAVDRVEMTIQWQPYRDREPLIRWFLALVESVAQPLRRA